MDKAEQETTITYDNEQQLVRIWTAKLADQGKLRRAGVLPIKGSQAYGFFYKFPFSQFKWRIVPLGKRHPKQVRPLSPAFIQARTARKGIPEGGTNGH